VALQVLQSGAAAQDRDAFLEEMILRRELSVNFVRYNRSYDRIESCEPWALRTLLWHARDSHLRTCTADQFERTDTHDPLWDAVQRQKVQSGWMHDYVRMYWAKKILEWSRSPEEAFQTAIRLNDRYELTGRDASDYAGIAWAIGGKHDRAWGPERSVYGTIRDLSSQRTAPKFDSQT